MEVLLRCLYGVTAIMAVPLRFMPYKHRNSTVVAPRLRCDGGISKLCCAVLLLQYICLSSDAIIIVDALASHEIYGADGVFS